MKLTKASDDSITIYTITHKLCGKVHQTSKCFFHEDKLPRKWIADYLKQMKNQLRRIK